MQTPAIALARSDDCLLCDCEVVILSIVTPADQRFRKNLEPGFDRVALIPGQAAQKP
jgi:hypothetical protein